MIVQKQFHIRGWNRKSQSLGKQQLHIRDADHLTPGIEQWSSTVSGVIFGCRLNLDLTAKIAIVRANKSL